MTAEAKTQKVSFFAVIASDKVVKDELKIIFDKATKRLPEHLGSSQRAIKVNLEIPESFFLDSTAEATIYVPEPPKVEVDGSGGTW